MKTEIAKLWVEALRSGEYKQGRKRLKKDGNYCCLGVLCDLHSKIGEKMHRHGWHGENNEEYIWQTTNLPFEVKRWAGIKTSDGIYGDSNRDSLVVDNDIKWLTFNEIADILERNVENL